jgi:heat shock protein HtpX
MISALKKISTDSRIEAIDWQSENIKGMFISEPGKMSYFSKLFSTHPPIEERIRLLERY